MPRNAWVIALALGLLASCTSTPDPGGALPAASTNSNGVSAAELALRNGLTSRFEPERNRLILEGPGSRVVLFPGTTVATVNGSRVQPMRRIQPIQNDGCELVAGDAQRIESMLRYPPQTSAARTPKRPQPPSPALTRVPSRPLLASAVEVGVRIPLERKWNFIVLHHSGTASGSAASFGRHHKQDNGWDGLGYHFVIGNGKGSGDGQLEIGYRWTEQRTGAHAGRAADGTNVMNETGIGICLVGTFEVTHPTARQLAMLRSLVAYLRAYCDIPEDHVLLHRDVRGTRCPGKHLSRQDLAGTTARQAAVKQ